MLSDHHGDVCPLAVTNIEQGSLLSVSGLLHFPATWGLWSRQQTKMDIQHSTAFSKGDRLPYQAAWYSATWVTWTNTPNTSHQKYFLYSPSTFHPTVTHPGCTWPLQDAREGVSFWAIAVRQPQWLTCITKWAPHTQVQRLRLHVPSSAALRHWRNSVGTFRAERSLIFWNSSFGLFSSYLRSASPFIHSQFKRFRNAQSLAPH